MFIHSYFILFVHITNEILIVSKISFYYSNMHVYTHGYPFSCIHIYILMSIFISIFTPIYVCHLIGHHASSNILQQLLCPLPYGTWRWPLSRFHAHMKAMRRQTPCAWKYVHKNYESQFAFTICVNVIECIDTNTFVYLYTCPNLSN